MNLKKTLSILIILIFSLSVFTGQISAKMASDTFILFIEAEDCVLSGYKPVDKDGAVGKAIVSSSDTDSFTVNFTAPNDGQYRIWMKLNNLTQGDNSLKYMYDGSELVFDFHENVGTEDLTNPIYGKWYWLEIMERGTEPLANGLSEWAEANNSVRHTPVILNLKAGDNSITFNVREIGGFIDQIIVTDDIEYNPGNVDGNYTFKCDFCNLEHFFLDPESDLGISPKAHFDQLLDSEIIKVEVTEPAAETTQPATVTVNVTTAPQTSDLTLIFFGIMSVTALITIKTLRQKSR